jgi:hypothetical protein
MKKLNTLLILLLVSVVSFGQEPSDESDTTKMRLKNKEILIIDIEEDDGPGKDERFVIKNGDTIRKKKRSEGHWAGIDFGFNLLMDNNFDNSFTDYPYWKNDAAKSQVWNINFAEYKFNFGTPYVGLTTGLGLNFTSVAFNDNFVLQETPDTLFATIDTVYSYTKNKLKASYLTVPLLLEFNTNANSHKSFYFAAGVVGGVRLASKVKRKGEFDGKDFVQKEKARYSLNAFKLDALVRLGFSDFGVFASYSLLPLFEDGKTAPIYPLTFGLSVNF